MLYATQKQYFQKQVESFQSSLGRGASKTALAEEYFFQLKGR